MMGTAATARLLARRALAGLAVAAALLAIRGCGSDREGGTDMADAATTMPRTDEATSARAGTATTPRASAPKRTGALVKVVDSQFGRVIADRKGEAFYLFDKERDGSADCYGACAVAWPPVLTKGAPRAGKGATQAKLGTTKRRSGVRQVTYAGHPLYYYVQDSPGNILCQNVDEFGGLWLVVKPSGKPVR
jgi:predicted lipoprotein with Yx(FWY)xxD motif